MSLVEVNDELLVQRMAVRDETALVELHRRYVSYLTAVARRMLRDSDEVQQCVQDVIARGGGRFNIDEEIEFFLTIK